MSGGVDSSVAAALLQKQGYFVSGAYMKNFSPESWQGILDPDCPWEQDVADAKAVCDKLDIKFRSLNFEREYNNEVIEYFFREYRAGRTPNPDIMCNKKIKFKLFLEKALDLGYDYIATGHYARIKTSLDPESGIRNYELLKGKDENKDQTYFLYTLNQKQLSKTLFPLGELTKPEVRQLARELGLLNAEKKDSQGICFVGEVNVIEFLKQRIPVKVGEIVTTDGEVVGSHENAAYYTYGQRHGFGIGGVGPFYMVGKDMKKNKVIVTGKHDDKLLYAKEIELKNIHWIGEKPKFPLKTKAQIRYRYLEQPGTLRKKGSRYKVVFEKKQRTPTTGQSVVFYKGDQILGGGVIEKVK